jgi:hypothetical protein
MSELPELQTVLLERNKYMADARELGEELHDAVMQIERLKDELKALTKPKETKPRTMPTPEQIVLDLIDGKLTPPEASVALYALQVIQTAQRNAHLIAATRQKEERLRRTSTQQSIGPSPSPKRPAGKSPTTTGAIPTTTGAIQRNSSRSRSTSQDARRSQTLQTPAAKPGKAKRRNQRGKA